MAYDIFHNYGFDKVTKRKSLTEAVSNDTYGAACKLMDVHMKELQKQYLEGDKAPSQILQSLGYMETPYDEHKYEQALKGVTLVFDFTDYDWDDGPIMYYVLDDEGRIPNGWCQTKATLEEPEDWTNEGCEMKDECEEDDKDFMNKSFERRYGEVDDDASYEDREGILTEAYNNLPTWFTNFLDKHVDGKSVKNVLSNRGIDLANATYIQGEMPRSNRDPVLKDPHRLAIFRLEDGHGPKVYIMGVNNPYLHVPSPGRSWDFKYAKELPMKTILELATEYGYIDTNDSRNSNRAVRGERAALRRAAGPQRGKGQYPVERTTYETDEYGRRDYDRPTGTSIEWVMSKGQDKSGYPLDPEKYKRMLDNVGLDTYGARLEAYYKKIEAIRSRIIACMNRFSVDDSSKFRSSGMFSRNMFGDIADATSSLSRAIEYYQRLKEDCAKCIKRWEGKATTEELDERIRELFQWNAKTVRDYIEDAATSVDKIENAKELVSDEE